MNQIAVSPFEFSLQKGRTYAHYRMGSDPKLIEKKRTCEMHFVANTPGLSFCSGCFFD